ncbi:hypothetical protein DOZ80_21520 [Pseudomonas fluorescens]|uniref:Uncharacterized protein n=1 Tax=Pseudomonas fluorescens TaxID=294 RepID=A0A327N1Z9_PSEFL|nr:hypothetical protein DOZ80_21520 [Pseudomonas fluorescens]
MVCAAQKYASEIEIFTFGRGFRTEISRSSVQKRRLNQSMTRLSGRTDFFNRIGRLLPVAKNSFRQSLLRACFRPILGCLRLRKNCHHQTYWPGTC